LGVEETAVIEGVEFDDDAELLVAHVRPASRQRSRCGLCRRPSPGYDGGEGRRRWRALDLGTVRAVLEAAATRVRCSEHGVVVAAVPWARHDAGHTYTFDATVAWPGYDWMGVAKAGLEAVTRYLARDLGPKGIRVNAVSAGPIKTMAGKGIPGFDQISGSWARRAPLGWGGEDPTPVGNAVAFLLSDLSSGITGELVHVDGGFHAMGTDLI